MYPLFLERLIASCDDDVSQNIDNQNFEDLLLWIFLLILFKI